MSQSKQQDSSKWDLTEQAAIYGSYHAHPINRLIHFIFVPQILFAFILWQNILPIKYAIPFASPEISALLGNLSFIASIALCAFYSTLDVVAAALLFILLTGLNATASSFVAQYGPAQAFVLGVFFQVIGWGSQIVVGHGMFEGTHRQVCCNNSGRAPAISESRFQALVSPFFLALEALFMFGYRKSLYEEIEKRTQQKIAAWKAATKKGN